MVIFIYALFAFLLLFLINYLTVKKPLVSIWNEEKLNSWFGRSNFGTQIVGTNFDIYIGKIFGGTEGIAGGFSAPDIQTGTYNDAVEYFNDNYAIGGYQVAVYELGNTKMFIGVLYTTHWYTLTLTNFMFPIQVTFKIISMIMLVTIFMAVTDNIQLNYAFWTILLPFKIFKAPIKTWSTIFSLAIRFVPSLIDESKVILKAQASRGVDFTNGNFKDKVKAISSLIIPMFTISFVKSIDLANAMDVRNYNPATANTQYRFYGIRIRNIVITSIFFILFGLIIMLIAFKVSIPPFNILDMTIIYGS